MGVIWVNQGELGVSQGHWVVNGDNMESAQIMRGQMRLYKVVASSACDSDCDQLKALGRWS